MAITDLEHVTPPAAGETIATRTINGKDVQVMLPIWGNATDQDYIRAATPMPVALYDAAADRLEFSAPDELTASPTIGTGACAQWDSLHTTIMTFANAARAVGKTGRIMGARLVCKHDTFTGKIALILFRKSFTGTTAQDVLAVSDADKLESFGALIFDFADATCPKLGGGKVALADRAYLPLDYKCDAGTSSIFGVLQLISADTPTFAAADLVPYLSYMKD